MKNTIEMFQSVADYSASNPLERVDPSGSKEFVYGIEECELKELFAKEGFNLNRQSWKDYIQTWKECNMIRTERNYHILTDHGLKLIPGGKTLIKQLEFANKVATKAVIIDARDTQQS